jgi:acetylornithine/N-succinyldiaminopimelate aminotransferase
MSVQTINSAAHRQSLMPITTRPEAAMVRGDGAYVFDENGSAYLDFIQGWAVNALGHCPPELVEALTRQAQLLISPSPALHNTPQFELAQFLTTSAGLHQAHFANSGAEANEAAVKLARRYGQRFRDGASTVITTNGAFHGRTLAMMAASGKPGWDTLFPPAVSGFTHVPFGDADAVVGAITADTVAIMVEPIQGEAGVVVPPKGYLTALRQIANDHGLLLIFDEIQTGIGRTGQMFAFEHEDARPDILTLGKGLGGGLPISAMLAAQHACCFEPGDQGGTFNGNPLMTAGALAVSQAVAKPELLAHVRDMGEQLMQMLAVMPGIRSVRGSGLLVAAELESPTAVAVAASAFGHGLLVNAPRPDTLRFMPSLRTSSEEIVLCKSKLGAALADVGLGVAA